MVIKQMKIKLFVMLIIGPLVSLAKVTNPVIEGNIASFDNNVVVLSHLNSDHGFKIPRDFLTKDIKVGQHVTMELKPDEFDQVQKLNERKK